MRVRGTSGRSASAALRGGRAPAPGTATRGNNSASEKRIKKIMISLRNSAIVMRYDFEGRLLEVVDSDHIAHEEWKRMRCTTTKDNRPRGT